MFCNERTARAEPLVIDIYEDPCGRWSVAASGSQARQFREGDLAASSAVAVAARCLYMHGPPSQGSPRPVSDWLSIVSPGSRFSQQIRPLQHTGEALARHIENKGGTRVEPPTIGIYRLRAAGGRQARPLGHGDPATWPRPWQARSTGTSPRSQGCNGAAASSVPAHPRPCGVTYRCRVTRVCAPVRNVPIVAANIVAAPRRSDTNLRNIRSVCPTFVLYHALRWL